MASLNVKGLQRFVDHFKGLENSYILIGGAACDVWLAERGFPFRVTKDLDVVIVVEALLPAFFDRFWSFIRDGRYRSHQQSEIRPVFYRFKSPEDARYPAMIELLSRNHLELPPEAHLTSIPAGEDISSLSAILLEDVYYHFVIRTRIVVGGVPIIPAHCLIPLKARAWLDLTARREAGLPVSSSDIKKHRYDVFRLYLSITPGSRFELPDQLRSDLIAFLAGLSPESEEWTPIRAAVRQTGNLPDPVTVLAQLRDNFQLGAGAAS